MNLYTVNPTRLAHLLGALNTAAPWLLAIAAALVLGAMLFQRRLNEIFLDLPASQTLLLLALVVQALALVGVWGSS